MRVVITGGSGFIGTNLVDHYVRDGHQVFNLDLVEPRNRAHLPHWRPCDIRDKVSVEQAFKAAHPDVVVHAAARTDLNGHTLEDYAANTDGVSHVLAALLSLPKPPMTVLLSSMLVCKLGYQPAHEEDYCPTTVYGQSKVVGERLVRAIPSGRLPWVMLRPTSIWGPWFAEPYRGFFEAVKRGIYLHPRGRSVRRNYGFVLNSVDQISRLVSSGGAGLLGRTVYLADRDPIELKSWAVLISTALHAPKVRDVPVPLLQLAAKVGDAAKAMGFQRPPMSTFRLQNMLTDCLVDTDPLDAVAGRSPFSLEQAVEITCRWMEDNRVSR